MSRSVCPVLVLLTACVADTGPAEPGAGDPKSEVSPEPAKLQALEDRVVLSVETRSPDGGSMGEDVAVCDLDDDGQVDLIVADRKVGERRGEVGVFYGPLTATGSLTLDDADATIEGTRPFRHVGSHLGCGDFDGDGWTDLMFTMAEDGEPAQDYGVAFLYGDGERLPARSTDMDADAILVADFGTPSLGYIWAPPLRTADLDGDGAVDMVLDLTILGETSTLSILSGARFSDGELLDAVVSELEVPTPDIVLGDATGDGRDDLVLARRGHEENRGWVGVVDDPLSLDGADALQVATTTVEGDSFAVQVGYTAAAGPVRPGEPALFLGAATASGEPVLLTYPSPSGTLHAADRATMATSTALGPVAEPRTELIGDWDGDGARDLLLTAMVEGEAVVTVLSAAALVDGDTTFEQAVRLWLAATPEDGVRLELAHGDLTGDGRPELVIGLTDRQVDGEDRGRVAIVSAEGA